jgi:hypothetical protein
MRAISHWMALCRDTQFVFCDGSGFDLSSDIRAVGAIDTSRIEVMAFENDRDKVKSKGKGHGEGEIIKYALVNSSILRSAQSFAKCTGKLWVENFWSCRRSYNGIAGFSHFGFLSPAAIDTRFFIVRKDFFQETLSEAYVNCDDADGKYLENIYLASLDNINRRRWMLPVYPRIRGLSGTSGKEYRSSIVKQLGKNFAIRVLRRGWP